LGQFPTYGNDTKAFILCMSAYLNSEVVEFLSGIQMTQSGTGIISTIKLALLVWFAHMGDNRNNCSMEKIFKYVLSRLNTILVADMSSSLL